MNSSKLKLALIAMLIIHHFNTTAQSDGTLDATFGTGGLVTIDNSNTDDGNDLLILESKDIIVGGTTNINSNDFSICALTSFGLPDNNFGTGGKLFVDIDSGSDDHLNALALDSNQRIVAAGYSSIDSNTYLTLIRISSLGVLDSSFGNNGIVMLNPTVINVAYDVAIQPDHKIVVAGYVNDTLTPLKACIIRLNEDGSYDGAFGDNGVWEGSPDPSYDVIAYSMALQSDGNILIAGYQDVNGDDQFAVGRILSGGSMDVNFGGDGWIVKNITNGTDDIAHSITLQNDDKILAAGESNGMIAICRLDTDGTDDVDFAANGTFIDPLDANDDLLYSVIIQPDQHIVAAGGGSINDNVDFLLIRLTPEGVFDSTFGTGGIVYTNFGYYTNDFAHSVLLQPDLDIVAAGSMVNGYATDFAIARYGSGATNIDNAETDQDVSIYPNPCEGNCFLRFKNPDHRQLTAEIIDVTGRRLMSFTLTENESLLSFEMNQQAGGIYFVQITDHSEQLVVAREKFIIR